jgi:micrococcal nuclease
MTARARVALLFLALLPCGPLPAAAQAPKDFLSAAEADRHIGEEATICGTVVSGTYAARSRGRPTFLNLDHPYPDHVFTIVIWGESRSNFPEPPETAYEGKTICVTGRIGQYRGKPQIVVTEPGAIRVIG